MQNEPARPAQFPAALRAGASHGAIALLLAAVIISEPVRAEHDGTVGHPQGSGGHQEGQGGPRGPGGEMGGDHEDGHDGDHEDGHDAGHDEGGPGTGGRGGPPETRAEDGSDGRGPQANRPAQTGGGKPVWAQEGIPEVELGRLNVVRSPDHVLAAAYDEALASMTQDMVDFYNLPFGEMISALSLAFEDQSYIDSPLQNLALLDDALDGSSVLANAGVTTSADQLSAVFLGVASDKTLAISEDTVIAITTILGHDLTDVQVSQLATEAEAIRIAVLAGHG